VINIGSTQYDVIVIGGGLGGLTAGAKLAKEGKQVLLLEQHDRPGGCATTFRRKGFTFEVGLHEMDGMDGRDMKTRVFRDLGVLDLCTFLTVPEFYRFVNGRHDIVVSHDPEETAAELCRHFPDEKKGITAYFDRIMNARKWMKESAGAEESTIGDFLDSVINDEDLKLVLLGNLGYFHDDPYSLSLNYYAMAQGSYYRGGGLYIQGGSQCLSNALASTIEKHGGRVLLNHAATGIRIESGRAAGVDYTRSGGDTGTGETANGKVIVANAAIPAVAEDLLPESVSGPLKKDVARRELGASLLTVYFGFNRPLNEAGSTHYSTFIYDESVKSQSDIRENNRGAFERRSFTFVDYSRVDARLAPEGKSVGALCCIDYLPDWEGLESAAYGKKKEEVARVFMERLESLIPGFRDAVEYYEVGTPKTVHRYTSNPGGAVYGFAQTPERAALGEIDGIDNLYYASAWTRTGGGFSGALMSGYLCALTILRKKQ